ncbi:hypothetical protein BT63DRAFT_411338 [Microthyrium microscopicum]|uniref:Alpha/beta-hydrolase n=1 Tax=Microthyrium microscopicum TaxID=703497 RepID=A0A6A6UJS7_9PEZI|nr:hypothetical protein BT63DRAFT_411338 [Microthyrium microscopicum]
MRCEIFSLAILFAGAQALPQAPAAPAAQPKSISIADILGALAQMIIGGQPGAQPGGSINTPEALASPGTGKFRPHFFNDSTLPDHTIYQPKDIPAGFKAPLIVWGNGGCIASGTIMAPFLLQLASQGAVVISNGAPGANGTGSYASFGTLGRSSSKWLTNAIDWAEKSAGQEKWKHIDMTRVAAAGQSCGGGEAYGVETDPRVKVMGIFNSGGMGFGSSAKSFTKPIFYFLGGPKDIAYSQGTGDYKALPADLPAWIGNWPPTSHGGTFNEVNGGVYGVAGAHWVNYALRGDKAEAAWFTGGGAKKDNWTEVDSKNMDKFTPPPPL